MAATGMVRQQQQQPGPTVLPQRHEQLHFKQQDALQSSIPSSSSRLPPPSLPSPGIDFSHDADRSGERPLFRRGLGREAQSRAAMQYARPLQRNNSYPPHASPKQDAGSSEHMLRRKTPNGILNAAYDGTAVEKTDRAHATKHILLPVSEQAVDGPPIHNFSLRPHAQTFDPGYNMSRNDGQQQYSAWPLPAEQPNPLWLFSQQPQLPQLDSMLNQIPLQNGNLPYLQAGHHPYAFMPPIMQPTFGPTASNDTGPPGPYWPNGTYVPYRPAAMRDMRYYPEHTSNWNGLPLAVDLATGTALWSSTSNPYPDFSNLNLNTQQSFMPSLNAQHYTPVQSSFGGAFYNNDVRPFGGNLNFTTSEDSLHRRQSSLGNAGYDGGLESGQTTPTPRNYQVSTTPLSDYGPDSSNAQLREKVFSWAHSIYIDLLKYLHEVRRRNHHNRHNGGNHSTGPNIYPRPPRQPGCDFSRPSRHRSHSHNEHIPRSARYDNESVDGGIAGQLHHLSRPFASRYADVPTWQQAPGQIRGGGGLDRHPSLRRMTTSLSPSYNSVMRVDVGPTGDASSALETLTELCRESDWKWIDGLLLGGCLAYALGDYNMATDWYSKILVLDPNHVEAMSNLAATMLATRRKKEAEQYWSQAVKLRPSYFEAVEHLVGLLCGEHRGKDAISVIEHVQKALRMPAKQDVSAVATDRRSERSSSLSESSSSANDALSDMPAFDFDDQTGGDSSNDKDGLPGSNQPGFGSSGYSIAGVDNGRILQLVHAKGNMLYAMHDNLGAAKAFEEAVMIGVGRQFGSISGLIKHILTTVHRASAPPERSTPGVDPILLVPNQAVETAKLCFPGYGELPGLTHIAREGQARKAVISTTSNSLLSLAKIFQDGMASSSAKANVFKSAFGVREILALYYLSLSLQPSPSTANNVGILLASVQQMAPRPMHPEHQKHLHPGVTPGSGIHLALLYYHYGLGLDAKHAHLYTNYGSLLKDIGQLQWAIQMYQKAVECDPRFDIALANLANAVKDTGRIADAIKYYKRAVEANPDFAEAVCGLANALNSVCGWRGRGGVVSKDGSYDRWHVNEEGMPVDSTRPGAQSSGWMKRVVELVDKQLGEGEDWGKGVINEEFVSMLMSSLGVIAPSEELAERQESLRSALESWAGQKWEGARVVRLVERVIKRLRWQWYQDQYVQRRERDKASYGRPRLPPTMGVPAAPTVLPFHTFTCPMNAKQVRYISQRNGLRISSSTLKAPWLPTTVYPPPPPPNPVLKVGYVSSDFNNHPLAHLMQSVFGLHDPSKVEAFCYATTASDNSAHRKQIEREAPHFYDATSWSTEKLVSKIVADGIHVLVNLNGYTRGARNEIFAARPAPVQMSFMGFAGTLGAEWCDYLLADETAVPVNTLRPWRRNVDVEDIIEDEASSMENEQWVYGENIVYCRDTFFCCDHRQSAPDAGLEKWGWEEELRRRREMRRELFPTLHEGAVIFGNFNQLYKIDPTTFRTWLRILAAVPNAILWLLRFPDLGEDYLRQFALQWSTPAVASRIVFTEVAPKLQHIARAAVCDLFLDTPECNAHTTAADVLWSGTPVLTLGRYDWKMCSRMAGSILKGALPKSNAGKQAATELIANDEEDYERKAIAFGNGLRYTSPAMDSRPEGRLVELRKMLFEERWRSGLFDTKRWVRDLEEAYAIAWKRWVKGEGGDIWLSEELGGSE